MYNNEDKAYSSIRISIGKDTKESELDNFINEISLRICKVKSII